MKLINFLFHTVLVYFFFTIPEARRETGQLSQQGGKTMDWSTGVRFSTRLVFPFATNCRLASPPTPASYAMGTGDFSAGIKRSACTVLR
jgi:hypothetical protein